MSAAERRQLARLGLAIAGGTAGAITVGAGLTAYTLGLRHAFDADHIAAIDNTTRKLMGEGRRPLSVGFFFALGHSTVVLPADGDAIVRRRLMSRSPCIPTSRHADMGTDHAGGVQMPVHNS